MAGILDKMVVGLNKGVNSVEMYENGIQCECGNLVNFDSAGQHLAIMEA